MDRIPCDYPMNKFHNFEDEVLKGERVSTIKDCETCKDECDLRHCLIQEPDMRGTLKNVRGDVTEPQRSIKDEIVIIPHCCNDKNIWGGGFVIALSNKWKEPEQRYRDFCKQKPLPMLGKVCYAKIDDHLAVANMVAQHDIVSKDNPIPIKYQALANCMFDVVGYIKMIEAKTGKTVVIHAPKFGSLRAKGNWDFILELIREIWLENNINVVIYDYVEKYPNPQK